MSVRARLAVDIGGTFTDIAIEVEGRRHSRKVLTTPARPEEAVMEGIGLMLADLKLGPSDIAVIVHGTTLATNALIERKGARTAMITTAGFRDTLEMAFENRFEQYDVYMDRPAPLVARHLRFTVPERIDARANVVTALDEGALARVVDEIVAQKIESVAICLLHSYLKPDHERRAGEIVRERTASVAVSLSCEVSPEIREYERFSTTCANAYVQPLMARYLGELDRRLRGEGFSAPLYMMTSGGGLTTLETAIRFPVRLVESGPAGGAILASHVAAECGAAEVLSFDMGGTTAKICLIDDHTPQRSRNFEVAREYRNLKGSGLPLRIPVIEMVEIGAGGGSIARIDPLGRVTVGPDSAGAEPGPACYDRGGERPTVTDADVAMARIDPATFAGGRIALAPQRAAQALAATIGTRLGMDEALAAFAVSEIADEGMANAARVHAIERGKVLSRRTLIAFGGAAPLHAARIAQRLGIDRIVVPASAGVGSAVGFLRAPISYEVVRSRYMRFDAFDTAAIDALLADMADEARAVVRKGAPDGDLIRTRTVDLRYVGQGHEIVVDLPPDKLDTAALATLRKSFEHAYVAHYGRLIPDVEVEALNWSVTVATPSPTLARIAAPAGAGAATPRGRRSVFDADSGAFIDHAVYWRFDLAPGAVIAGPAIVAEDETSTLVPPGFGAHLDGAGHLVLERSSEGVPS